MPKQSAYTEELKYQDTIQVGTTAINTGWAANENALYNFPKMAQGTTQNTRIGRSIRVKRITIKMSILVSWDSSDASPVGDIYITSRVRVMLVRNNQTNGTVCLGSGNHGVMEAATAQVSNTDSFRNLECGPLRYDVLKDTVLTFNPPQGLTSVATSQNMNQQQKSVIWDVKLDDHVSFKANAGDITDLDSISYAIVLCHDDQYGAGLVSSNKEASAGISFIARLRYTG